MHRSLSTRLNSRLLFSLSHAFGTLSRRSLSKQTVVINTPRRVPFIQKRRMATTPKEITPAFLDSLKSAFPLIPSNSNNPWFIVASVAFSASNRPDGVGRVFERALHDLRATNGRSPDEQREVELVLASKLRDAIFKSGLISGYPKAINALRALHDVMPEELRAKKVSRDTTKSLAAYEEQGIQMFESVYGDQAPVVQNILDAAYPDMGWFSKAIGYGVVYSSPTLSHVEFSYTMIASLIAGDTPEQISWHLEGAKRGGASLEEVRAVRKVAMDVARFAGVTWRNGVPEVS